MQTVDRIIWNLVPQSKTIPKQFLKKAVKKFGNSSKLSQKLNISRQRMSNIINKTCKKGQRVVNETTAKKWGKIVKIKGFAEAISRPY